MQKIEDLIHEAINQALTIKTLYDKGLLTRGEFEELVEDLKDIRRMEKLVTTVEHKVLLKDTLQLLSTLLVP